VQEAQKSANERLPTMVISYFEKIFMAEDGFLAMIKEKARITENTKQKILKNYIFYLLKIILHPSSNLTINHSFDSKLTDFLDEQHTHMKSLFSSSVRSAPQERGGPSHNKEKESLEFGETKFELSFSMLKLSDSLRKYMQENAINLASANDRGKIVDLLFDKRKREIVFKEKEIENSIYQYVNNQLLNGIEGNNLEVTNRISKAKELTEYICLLFKKEYISYLIESISDLDKLPRGISFKLALLPEDSKRSKLIKDRITVEREIVE